MAIGYIIESDGVAVGDPWGSFHETVRAIMSGEAERPTAVFVSWDYGHGRFDERADISAGVCDALEQRLLAMPADEREDKLYAGSSVRHFLEHQLGLAEVAALMCEGVS